MSAPAARRLRDRNGVAGPKSAAAQKSTKSSSPLPVPGQQHSNSAMKRSLPGKENSRASSRIERPAIRSVPRVDKAAAAAAAVGPGSEGGERRMRRSMPSAPRGRSPSPSEFIRVLRDSRVSRGESDHRLVSSAGKKAGARGFMNCKENGGFGVESAKKGRTCKESDIKMEESEKNLTGLKVLRDICKKEVTFSLNSTKLSEVDDVGDMLPDSRVASGVKSDKLTVHKSGSEIKMDCLKECSDQSGSKTKVLEKSKEMRLVEGNVASKVGVKYPSKLHEKLAFLEGKVKRIASDIKRTKEMLDMNNPDASKGILSDIQDKISGIEKAMGHDAVDSSRTSGTDIGDNKIDEKCESEKVDDVKVSVKAFNNEELEARLFPHHRLLRNRTSMKVSSGCSQNNDNINFNESSREIKTGQKLLSPIEANSIAPEFVALLGKEDKKVILKDAVAVSASCEVQETEGTVVSEKYESSMMLNGKSEGELVLTADETLDEFDDEENRNAIVVGEETEDNCTNQVNEIGSKNTTGGWFVSEGEAVVLAHDNGSCSFYDIANCEEKAVYKPPTGVSPNMWRDCWIIRAPGADGCSGRYVVAASAGNALDSGFCSWDFYSKDVRAFHTEDGETTTLRTVLCPLPNNATYRRNALCSMPFSETQQWWYKPCGPLIVSTASSQRVVKIFDIRDGEQIMKWEVQKPVLAMDYSSPLQWRNRGKIVTAEAETISVWDVNSLSPQSLLSISLSGRKLSALHVVNTDAELGGGIRQRVTSSEAEGNDGVFCTPDFINVLDFRHPSGIGLKIPKIGVSVHSVFTRGDTVYVGCANTRSANKRQPCSQVQQYSLRKQRLASTFSLPDSNAHSYHSAITQVWGNSKLVMGVCGQGLFVFDALNDELLQPLSADYSSAQKVRDVVGPDDLYSPTFDYLASRVLLISRDRPAMWRHLS